MIRLPLEPVRSLSIALVGTAALGVGLPLVLGFPNLSILGLYVAVPMIAAPLAVRRFGTDRRDPGGSTPTVRVDWRLWSTAFHLLAGALVVVLVATDVRPYGFYAGVAALYGLCFLLIVTGDGRSRRAVALYHLVAVLLLVVYSVTLNYDFFVGHTDLSAHTAIVRSILETGRTATVVPIYESFQLWHVYAAFGSLLLGDAVAAHTTAYALSGGLFAAGLGLIDGLARRLHPDETFGLLSALVAVAFPLYLFYGMYSIPRSATSIFLLALLVALASRPTAGVRLLTVGLVVAIVIAHPATIPFVLAIFALVALAERTTARPEPLVDAYVLAVSVLATGLYWLYAAEGVVTRLAGTIEATLSGASESAVPEGVVASPWVEVANYVPYGFALFFLLVGVLFLLERRGRGADATEDVPDAAVAGDGGRLRSPHLLTVGLVAVALAPLVFPGPLLLLDALAGVNVDRFGHYAFAFVALTGGYGLYELVSRGGLAVLLAALAVLSLFGFAAVSNDFTASDNPVVERPFYTFYLEDEERDSFEAIDDRYRGAFGADRISCRYLGELHGARCSVIDAAAGEAMFESHDAVLVREGELEDRPLQFSAYVEEADLPREELEERDRVYDSGTVSFHA